MTMQTAGLKRNSYSGALQCPDLNIMTFISKNDGYLNVILGGIEIFVDLSQTTIHVPQQDHTQGGCGAQHACGQLHHLYWLDRQKCGTKIWRMTSVRSSYKSLGWLHRRVFFTMVLVLVQPFVAIICEQLILPKRCIDKAVYEGRGQVHTSRVHLGTTASEPWGTQRSYRIPKHFWHVHEC